MCREVPFGPAAFLRAPIIIGRQAYAFSIVPFLTALMLNWLIPKLSKNAKTIFKLHFNVVLLLIRSSIINGQYHGVTYKQAGIQNLVKYQVNNNFISLAYL